MMRSVPALNRASRVLLRWYAIAAILVCGSAAHAGTETSAAQATKENAADPASAALPTKATPQKSRASEPITRKQRLRWAVWGTIGPRDLVAGVFASGFGTMVNDPHEDGPHWSGFAERYGIRLTGVATQNLMEAGIGSIWGEDPRYFRSPVLGFRARMRQVVKLTFEAQRPDGTMAPAYARFIAIPSGNFLSNAWRANSEADSEHAMIRTAEGFGARMASNAFREFAPVVASRVFHIGSPE